ncbi:MAG: hypothetical protein A3D20_01440 [Nitrospinae bacterium RIFCSPHIGHO2_02_FULL_39_82]|nr:MAG: hypothetical protein A3D20_01440 [Nitrospinae bacterium RIFCSPHIGHO2_02_FULL_39_82]
MFLRICQILHRWTGLLIVPLILISTLTGFLILHRDGLSLYEKPVQNSIFLWLYGEPKTFEIDGEKVTEEYPPSWGKVLSSFHDGRFRGRSFILIVDILTISLIILSVTGPYLYIKKLQFKKGIPVSERLEDLDYLQILDRFSKLKGKSMEIKDRIDDLHKIVEHIFSHTKDKEIAMKEDELIFIEDHIKELDSKTHEIMEKMKSDQISP